MYTRIVVPVDGSPFSEQALPAALPLARRAGATVELVRVHTPLWPDPISWMPYAPEMIEGWESEATEAEERYLRELAERIAGETGLRPAWTLLCGNVVVAIEDLVRRSGADLVALTTHGRGGLARAWLGSVADGLLRHLEVPMLLVHAGEAAVAPGTELRLQRILVPLDGSTVAEAAVEPALALARVVGGSLTLLSVVVPFFPPGSLAVASTMPPAIEIEPMIDQANAYLAGVAERLRTESLTVHTHVSLHTNPGTAILDFAAEHGMELVALSTRGRGGVSRLVLGSVADKVIRGSSVPVLVRRPAKA